MRIGSQTWIPRALNRALAFALVCSSALMTVGCSSEKPPGVEGAYVNKPGEVDPPATKPKNIRAEGGPTTAPTGPGTGTGIQ